ncbi:MAG: anhydro-N-acetylmuramic acid kinase [Pontibacterium sp.]
MQQASIYIGLMSGTSLDGIDAVAVRFSPAFELLGTGSLALPAPLRQQILTLCNPGDNEIDQMGSLDLALADQFAKATTDLLGRLNLSNRQIKAIGSHGQTIRHRPEAGFTLQIGDANRIAECTGITTVADFRRRDMAAGGQGAPLVPAFHQALFRSPSQTRFLVNIGGMANITLLPAEPAEAVIGYDTGPGNVLLDAWIQEQQGQPYDKQGNWAASGHVNQALLKQLLSLAFFKAPAPKSTGREQFNLAWLKQQIQRLKSPISAEDIQATLLELTAQSIAVSIRSHTIDAPYQVFVCGGGSHNDHLLKRLAELLEPATVSTTSALGLDPDWVEACAFAWLAKQTLTGLSGNLPEVTGACGERVLGAIYPA